MSAIAAAFVAVAALGLVALYLRRPPEIRLRVAAARFLGELSPASRAPVQFARARALLTWRFLLRLALFAALLAAAVVDITMGGLPARGRIGLRLVIDTSASMGIGSGETRGAAAQALAAGLIRRLGDRSGDAEVCLSIVAVDDHILPLTADAVLTGRYSQASRIAGGPALLAQAASADDPACPVTHAVIVTDRPKMLVPPGPGGRSILWWQAGRPEGNIAVGAITATGDALAGGRAGIRVELPRFGAPAAPRALHVTGPAGDDVPFTAPDWLSAVPVIDFATGRPGTYVVALDGGGAFAEDDRVEIRIAGLDPVAIDWRLDTLPRPPAFRPGTGPDAVLVAPVALAAEAAGRRAVLFLGALAERPGGLRIGAFVEDDPLLRDLNLDILDRAAPPGVVPPTGFLPVVQEAGVATTRVVVARRLQPPAALIPAPGVSDAARKAGVLLLFNALRAVTADLQPRIEIRRLGTDGAAFDNVLLESDSAADGDRGDLDQPIEPPSSATRGAHQPLWPWLAVIAVALLLVDRLIGYRWRTAS